jgi:hypothetical protein
MHRFTPQGCPMESVSFGRVDMECLWVKVQISQPNSWPWHFTFINVICKAGHFCKWYIIDVAYRLVFPKERCQHQQPGFGNAECQRERERQRQKCFPCPSS